MSVWLIARLDTLGVKAIAVSICVSIPSGWGHTLVNVSVTIIVGLITALFCVRVNLRISVVTVSRYGGEPLHTFASLDRWLLSVAVAISVDIPDSARMCRRVGIITVRGVVNVTAGRIAALGAVFGISKRVSIEICIPVVWLAHRRVVVITIQGMDDPVFINIQTIGCMLVADEDAA